MENRLLMCATYLKEAEEKLLALQESLQVEPGQRVKVAEALSFVQRARNAVSETKTTVDSLQNMKKGKKLNLLEGVLVFTICGGLASFLVWFQFNSTRGAAIDASLGILSWCVIGFVGTIVGVSALNALISTRLSPYAGLILAVLIPVASFLLYVNAMRNSLAGF